MARKKQGTEAVLDPIELDTNMPTETLEAVSAPETAEATESKKVKVSGERKTGQELLDFVRENQELPGSELAFGAGYYTKTTDVETGETSTRIHTNEFFKAVTEASTGIVIPTVKRAYSSRRGRAPIVTVGKMGNCVVGARHTAIAGFAAGSKVRVTAEEGRIVLELDPDAATGATAADESDELDI